MTTNRLLVLGTWILAITLAIVLTIALWATSCPDTLEADGSNTKAACGQTRTLLALLVGGAIGVLGAVRIVRHGRPRRERDPWEW